VLLIAGDALLGRHLVTDGEGTLREGDWHGAGRWIWVETGPVVLRHSPGPGCPVRG